MRKIGLARLETRCVARKGNPCPSMSMLWAIMVAIVLPSIPKDNMEALNAGRSLFGGPEW